MAKFTNEELLYIAELLEYEFECNENEMAPALFEKIHSVIRPLREGDEYELKHVGQPRP